MLIVFFLYFPCQILAVEILQHRFNIEKMVKISEILLTYSDEGDSSDLRVQYKKQQLLKQQYTIIITDHENGENHICPFKLNGST